MAGPIHLDPVVPVAVVGDPNRNNSLDRAELLQAARRLEATLLRTTVDALQRAQLEQGFFGSGPQRQGMEATFEHFLGEALGTERGAGRGTGLAEQIVAQWLRGREPVAAEQARQAHAFSIDPDPSSFLRSTAQVAGTPTEKSGATPQVGPSDRWRRLEER